MVKLLYIFFDLIEWFPFKRKFILYEEFTDDYYDKNVSTKEFINYINSLNGNELRLFHILNNNSLAASYCVYFNIHPSNFIRNTIGLGALSTIKIDKYKHKDENKIQKSNV